MNTPIKLYGNKWLRPRVSCVYCDQGPLWHASPSWETAIRSQACHVVWVSKIYIHFSLVAATTGMPQWCLGQWTQLFFHLWLTSMANSPHANWTHAEHHGKYPKEPQHTFAANPQPRTAYQQLAFLGPKPCSCLVTSKEAHCCVIIKFLQLPNNGTRCAEGVQMGHLALPHKPFCSTVCITLVRTPITCFTVPLDARWYGIIVLSLMPSLSQIMHISPIDNLHALSVMASHSLLFDSCSATCFESVEHVCCLWLKTQWHLSMIPWSGWAEVLHPLLEYDCWAQESGHPSG